MRLGVNWAELALWILTGWTLIGFVGITYSFFKQERAKALHHLCWIAGIWLLYIATLLVVSISSRPSVLPQGNEQCLGTLCFTVVRTEAIPGYLSNENEQLLRVSLRITNRSSEEKKSDKLLRAYLTDSQSHRWEEVWGLEGVRLSTTVPPGGSIVSELVFKVTKGATDLRLVLTHGHRLPYVLLFGDRDSLLHPPVYVRLETQN